MANQQVLLGETVAAMKKALKRTAYESDSDNDLEHYSNRGNKLKKRALFARQGQLAPPTGPESYKEDVDYAGQTRSIISRNPPILDDEGYEVDSEDEDEERVQEVIESAAELNPYANIHIDQLLAPLTASTDLPTHITLSKPFTVDTLTNLAEQSNYIMRKENRSLWRIKHLFTRLSGDHTWAPCEMMLGSNDAELYSDDAVAQARLREMREFATENTDQSAVAAVNGERQPRSPRNGESQSFEQVGESEANTQQGNDGDVSMTDAETNGAKIPGKDAIREEYEQGDVQNETTDEHIKKSVEPDTSTSDQLANGKPTGPHKTDAKSTEEATQDATQPKDPTAQFGTENGDVEMRQGSSPDPPASHPAEDSAGSKNKNKDDSDQEHPALPAAPDVYSEVFVHPIFRPPPHAQPDRGGLSEAEAEDMQRLVALYVQKQEEVCRGANKLHEGLLKADRLRKTVLRWSKAEAHCGVNQDMSDGEDWYDKEEWGLTEDLKKGQDEEEEDTGTATKKTRNRR